MRWLFLLLLLPALHASGSTSPTNTTATQDEQVSPPVATIIPFLEELGLANHQDAFIKAGFDEVQYVMRMKQVDFLNLRREHDVPEEDIKKIQSAIKARTQSLPGHLPPPTTSQKERRGKLTFGRLYLDRSISSFEYHTAHFGSDVLSHPAPLMLADPIHACRKLRNNVTGAMVVAVRGRCAYLDKASNVSAANASALVIVNNQEELYRMSGGYALGDNPVNVTLPRNITVVMVRSSSLPVLRRAAAAHTPARLIPLECGGGRSVCEAVLPEEKRYITNTTMDSGYLVVRFTNQRFEFVTSTFGGVFPRGPLLLQDVKPSHACGRIPSGWLGWLGYFITSAIYDLAHGYGWPQDGSPLQGAVAMVGRGKCPFATKAENLQGSGAKVMMVVSDTHAIENFGAMGKTMSRIYIPGLMVTNDTGEKLRKMVEEAEKGEVPPVIVEIHMAEKSFAEQWREVSHMEWPEDQDKAREMYERMKRENAGSEERQGVVERRYQEYSSRKGEGGGQERDKDRGSEEL